MKSYHFLEEQICNEGCIINFVAWNKMSDFLKSIHYHKDGISTSLCSWEHKNEIHGDVNQRQRKNGQKIIKTMG